MPLRQTPPASDNIEINDKHLRERFVTQKTYLDHCAQSYNYAADYGFKGPAGPREALSGGPLISITGLISLLLLFPLPSYLSSLCPFPAPRSQEALNSPFRRHLATGPTLPPFVLEISSYCSLVELLFVSPNLTRFRSPIVFSLAVA